MRIVVCVRQSASGELNPFDACCYEAALRVPGAEVTLLSMGPPKTEGFLENLTRLGAKEAVLLSDPAFAGADTLATAYTLSLAVKRLAPELVLCGRRTMDGDTGQVGIELAEFCHFPLAAEIMTLACAEDSVRYTDRSGGEGELPYPALLIPERINTLRLPSIRSRKAPVSVWSLKELNADPSRTGLRGSPTRVLKTFENDTDRRKCRFISWEELDPVIRAALAEKPAAIQGNACPNPLKKVWAIGQAAAEFAETVSDDITVYPPEDAERICERILREQPKAVLWGSDAASRKLAATVAARLGLGLCADCVSLETDGSELFMYRPAFSGSIIAKIRSASSPVMATVRTTEPEQRELIVGIGLGAVGRQDLARALAEKYGGELAASRLAVERDDLPYPLQVGLTGRTVSPKVYLALGISGAVHHLAGIRKSGVIIAVNRDRSAPIFNYADYGIVADIDSL